MPPEVISKEEFADLRNAVGRIEKAIHGDDDRPGIRMRIDRLEQAQETASRLMWIAVTAGIVSLFGGLVSAIAVVIKVAAITPKIPQ